MGMAVTVYTTPTCQFCKKTKEFLDEHDVAFEEKDVANDTDAAKEMIRISGQRNVPVIVVENGEETVITGFDKEKLQDVLDV